MTARPWLSLAPSLAAWLLLVPSVAAADLNPCRAVALECRAGETFLDATYRLDLANPGRDDAELLLMPSVDVLERVEGAERGLILGRRAGALTASLPAGWEGEVVLHVKQRVARPDGGAAFSARLPLPPAVSRTIRLELPGPRMDVQAGPDCVVRALRDDLSAFRIVPLAGDMVNLTWRRLPPPRPPAYNLREVHLVRAEPPAFADEVTLAFTFPDVPPPTLSVRVPAGVALERVRATGGASWRIAGDLITVRVPEGVGRDGIRLVCRASGRAEPGEGGEHLLTVPLFASPEARRYGGEVYLSGGRSEMSFVALEGASQVAARGRGWQLGCDLREPGARVVARIVPIELSVHARLETHFRVTAFKVDGCHAVLVGEGLPSIESVALRLPAGDAVRAVSCELPVEWHQEGATLTVKPRLPAAGPLAFGVLTERLTGNGPTVRLAPPAVVGASSSEFTVALSAGPNVLLKTGGPAESWRVGPQTLPDWLGALSPEVAYRYREQAVPLDVEVLPVESELRGTVQDHVTVREDRILREALFLLEVGRRPVEELALALPDGLTVERLGGPLVETWEPGPDAGEVTISLRRPVEGDLLIQLAASRPFAPGPTTLHGLLLRGAPNLKGWLGISGEVSVRVRPMEDGQMNLVSVRTDRAPEYLAAFENKMLYELYESRWELDLLAEPVPAFYSAEALHVLRFRAGAAEATAFFNVDVEQGGAATLAFRLPAGASGARFTGLDVVSSRVEDGVLRARFRGKRTGRTACRVDYVLLTGTEAAGAEIEPVALLGAREQTGTLLLLQARPDAEVRPGAPPRALTPGEARESYAAWSYEREHPALAAYDYRGAGWSLPVTVEAHGLSEQMLRANVPVARLDTLMREGEEAIHHLRLYVSNTGRQFLTVDMTPLGEGARLVGTYAFGEPVKPFREEGRLQLPLFTSERAAELGMAVLDVIYATPHAGLSALRRQSLALPGLDVNVGQIEWTVRLPEGCRLGGVGGSMGRPESAPAAPSLAGMLLGPVGEFAAHHWLWALLGALGATACWLTYLGLRFILSGANLWTVAKVTAVVMVLAFVLAVMFMPSLTRARCEAQKSLQQSNLYNLGLGIAMYQDDHDGVMPRSLNQLIQEGLLEADALDMLNEEQELVYRRLPPDAPAASAVAYAWPAVSGGANVLFNDGAVMWVDLDGDGSLRNPWMEELIARAPTTAPARAAGEAEFAATELEAEELALAFELEQQMAPAEQAAPPQLAEQRQRALAQTMLDQRKDQLAEALRLYLEDHEGKAPVSAEDLAGYVADAELLDALAVQRQIAREELAGEPPPELAARGERPAADEEQLAAGRYNLGRAFMDKGEYDAAIENFRRALEMNEQHEQARRLLGQAEAMRRTVRKRARAATEAAARPARAAEPLGVQVSELATLGEQLAEREADLKADKLAKGRTEWRGRGAERAETFAVAGEAPEPIGAAVAVGQPPEAARAPLRKGRASLVKQVGGGRSLGARPITIDFPTPATASYRFVKPFLGRAEATVSFNAVKRAAALLAELLLAAAAVAAYLALRAWRPSAAVHFAGAALALTVAVQIWASAATGAVFAASGWAMGVCLAATAVGLAARRLRPAPEGA
jgi:tetratricopeptide (TPR) repeat protein